MKVKNKVFGAVFGVIASSLVFIAVPVSANAGDCTAADPCMTYAEVDSSGNVTNVIVCQPSVCGPNGQFGGTLNGNRLVPQAAANPQTNDTRGTKGEMSHPDQNQVVTLSNDNVFTVKKDNAVVERIVVPEIESTVNGNVTTSMNYVTETRTVASSPDASIPLSSVSPDQLVSTDVEVSTINATQITKTDVTTIIISEQLVIEGKKTEAEVISIVNDKNYILFKAKMSMLTRLLEDWFM